MKCYTGSIVLYKNKLEVLEAAIQSFLNTDLDIHLYLIDNSPTNILKEIVITPNITYIHNPLNPGFGASHNIAICKAIEAGSHYHFIVNPDIYYEVDILTPMVNYMKQNVKIGMMMPQIINLDGSKQYLPKLLPNPLAIIRRKIKFPQKAYHNFIEKYELRFVGDNVTYDAPIISGCFTLLRLKAIEEVGSYDEKYFMYFEDWDLSRRMNLKYDTIYFPEVSVYHEYASGANRSFKLFKIYLKSAFHYFNKWGWFFDKDRNEINKKTLGQF